MNQDVVTSGIYTMQNQVEDKSYFVLLEEDIIKNGEKKQ